MPTLAAKPIPTPTEPVIVEVEDKFYHKLINIAYKAFSNVPFYDLKADVLADLQAADTTEQLVLKTKRFIDEREFVDKVLSEKEKIEYGQL